MEVKWSLGILLVQRLLHNHDFVEKSSSPLFLADEEKLHLQQPEQYSFVEDWLVCCVCLSPKMYYCAFSGFRLPDFSVGVDVQVRI